MTNESIGSEQGPSLLWPNRETKPNAAWLLDEVIRDLGLAAILQAMCPHKLHREAIEAVLYRLCGDTAVITYRQAVLADLLRFPALAQPTSIEIPYHRTSLQTCPALKYPKEPCLDQCPVLH